MNKRFFLMFLGLILVLVPVFSDTSLDPDLKKAFDAYVVQIIAADEVVEIDSGSYVIPIKPDGQELCDKIVQYLNDGGRIATYQSWYMWIVSFDKENNQFILTDSGM